MKITILLLSLLASGAAAAAADACGAGQREACEAALQRSMKKCDRYHLKETVAFIMCQDSALARRKQCLTRIEQTCADAAPAEGDPGAAAP